MQATQPNCVVWLRNNYQYSVTPSGCIYRSFIRLYYRLKCKSCFLLYLATTYFGRIIGFVWVLLTLFYSILSFVSHVYTVRWIISAKILLRCIRCHGVDVIHTCYYSCAYTCLCSYVCCNGLSTYDSHLGWLYRCTVLVWRLRMPSNI
jgi:hypothetical protein